MLSLVFAISAGMQKLGRNSGQDVEFFLHRRRPQMEDWGSMLIDRSSASTQHSRYVLGRASTKELAEETMIIITSHFVETIH